MAKERKTLRQAGKSDPIDALAVARAAVSEPELPLARLAGAEREIKLLADHRDDLVAESTRHQRRLRWHLHELDPELQPPLRLLAAPKNLDRLARRLGALEQTTQVAICRELVRRIRELARRCAALERELGRLVRRECLALIELPGCGVLTAARILAEVADVERFKDERHLAAYAGVAPLDASSGRQQRHRLNRTGNRRLNRALHVIAITQVRVFAPARAYRARRLTEGKTKREALRALNRHVARRIYRILAVARRRHEWRSAPPTPGARPNFCLT
jgi:transposase